MLRWGKYLEFWETQNLYKDTLLWRNISINYFIVMQTWENHDMFLEIH